MGKKFDLEDYFDLSIGDTTLLFRISGIGTVNFDDFWCNVHLNIKNNNFNYKTNGSEMLNLDDVIYLRDMIYKILEEKIESKYTVEFTEPDLKFLLQRFKIRTVNFNTGEEGTEISNCWGTLILKLRENDGSYNNQSYHYDLSQSYLESLKTYLDDIIPLLEEKCKEKIW